jgi:hypothetical protein
MKLIRQGVTIASFVHVSDSPAMMKTFHARWRLSRFAAWR